MINDIDHGSQIRTADPPAPAPNDATINKSLSLEDLREVVADQALEVCDITSTAEIIAEKLSPRKIGHHMPTGVQEALAAVSDAAGELEWALDSWRDDLDAELDQ